MTDWEAVNHHLAFSANLAERRHFYLGRSLWGGLPILLDKEILRDHAYIRGATGSHKTSIGIAPLVVKLIRQAEDALVLIDLKGEDALRAQVQDECERAGRKFRLFTNVINRATHVFNPFLAAHVAELSINQIVETFLEALGVSYGEGYGRGYYSAVARRWLADVTRSHPHIRSFEELYDLRAWGGGSARDNFELIAVIESLSHFPQLNMRPGAPQHSRQVMDAAIHFPRVVDEKEVVYFYLPATREATTVREIAKLAVFSLLQAHNSRPRTKPRAQTFCFIDEFGQIVSQGFKAILEQSRSLGIGFILSNQTFASLQTADTDLRPVVAQNTRFKQIFSERDDEEIQRICRSSGQIIGDPQWWMRAYNAKGYEATGIPAVEHGAVNMPTGPTRLSYNQMLTLNDDPFASVIAVESGSGFSQFAGFSVPITMGGHTITAKAYQQYEQTPWPDPTPGTIVVRREPPTPEDIKKERRSHLGTEDMEPMLFDDEASPGTPKRRRGRPRKKE